MSTVDDLRVAPFHLLASEGKVHVDQSHAWHLETLAKLTRTGEECWSWALELSEAVRAGLGETDETRGQRGP